MIKNTQLKKLIDSSLTPFLLLMSIFFFIVSIILVISAFTQVYNGT
jgi:hypothetical protein